MQELLNVLTALSMVLLIIAVALQRMLLRQVVTRVNQLIEINQMWVDWARAQVNINETINETIGEVIKEVYEAGSTPPVHDGGSLPN